MKKVIVLLSLLVVAAILTPAAKAADASPSSGTAAQDTLANGSLTPEDIQESQADALGTDKLENALPEGAGQTLGNMGVTDSLDLNGGVQKLVKSAESSLGGIVLSTLKSAAFAQVRLNPAGRLSLRLGGRYDHHGYTGHGYFAPRVGLRYRLTGSFWLTGAYGVHYQSPSYLELTVHPDNKRLEDYHTNQAVLGTEWLPRSDTRLTLEAYTKQYRDVPVSQAWTTPDPWDSDEGRLVNAARGHSEGIEFYLQRKMSSSYQYILSYSLYRARFEDPRTGRERPWDFDHRNVLTLSASKRWKPGGSPWYRGMRGKAWYKATAWLLPFGDEVLLSAKWRYTGGRPYTDPLYLRGNHVWILPEDTVYNGERFPDYQRLDIRLDRRFFFKGWSLAAYLDIMNIGGRRNVWDYSRNEFGKVEKVYQFNTMPVGGFSMEF
jgi:hypothetical protein